MVPVHLLAFGVQSFLTTIVCLIEMWGWTDRTIDQKQQLSMLYAPYAALGRFSRLPAFLFLLSLYFRVFVCGGQVLIRMCACAGGFIALDMVFRLRRQILAKSKHQKGE